MKNRITLKEKGKGKPFKKAAVDFLVLNLLLVIFTLVSSAFFSIVINNISNDYVRSACKLILDFAGILLSLVVFYRWRLRGSLFIKLFQMKLKGRFTTVVLFIASFTALLFAVTLYIMGSLKYDGFIWSKLYSEDIIAIILVGVIECFSEVFTEEVLFRYAVNEFFRKLFSWRITLVFSTAYYLIIHSLDSGVTVFVLINLVLLHIILSFLYYFTKNIWYCVLIRGMFEYITAYGCSINRMGRDEVGIIFLSRGSNTIFNGGVFGAYGSIVMTVILAVLGCCLLLVYRKKKEIAGLGS